MQQYKALSSDSSRKKNSTANTSSNHNEYHANEYSINLNELAHRVL